jgi:hypothetical protein
MKSVIGEPDTAETEDPTPEPSQELIF